MSADGVPGICSHCSIKTNKSIKSTSPSGSKSEGAKKITLAVSLINVHFVIARRIRIGNNIDSPDVYSLGHGYINISRIAWI